jgi:hypothetical protein
MSHDKTAAVPVTLENYFTPQLEIHLHPLSLATARLHLNWIGPFLRLHLDGE